MEVSPITLVWSMGAAVCLTLGGIHLLVGIGRKEGRGTHLLFAATAFSVVGVILAELLAFKAVTLEALVSAFKVSGGFQFLAWLGMVWFVVYYCRLTNLWGACLASAAFAFAAVVHLMSPYGITHDEIASFSLYGLPWGEQIALPVGSRNVWWLLSLCGILVLMFFLGGAVARVVRRGDWNKATRLAVASTVFLLAYLHTLFVDYGLLTSPRFLGVAFVGFLLIVGSDLGGEIIRTLSSGVASNERRWRTLFEEVQFSVLGINVRGQIAYANPHLASRMGIDVEDLLGRDVVEILDEEIAEGFDLRLEYAFREGPSPSAQLTMRTGSGAKREFTWSFVRLVSQDGMVEGLLAIGADMTDHANTGREKEAALREAARLREQLVQLPKLEKETAILQAELEKARALKPAPESKPFPLVDRPAASTTAGYPVDMPLREVEKRHIQRVLDACDGQIAGKGGAAEILGINPSTLRSRMKKLAIQTGK